MEKCQLYVGTNTCQQFIIDSYGYCGLLKLGCQFSANTDFDSYTASPRNCAFNSALSFP